MPALPQEQSGSVPFARLSALRDSFDAGGNYGALSDNMGFELAATNASTFFTGATRFGQRFGIPPFNMLSDQELIAISSAW
jgi:hypothetical protein